MMYCGICSDCCRKNHLCEDCGHPINSPVDACTGFHGQIYVPIVGDGWFVMTPYMKMREEHAKEEYEKYKEALKLVRDFLEKSEATEEVKNALSIIAHPPRSEWI